jgi:hypothetical protein
LQNIILGEKKDIIGIIPIEVTKTEEKNVGINIFKKMLKNIRKKCQVLTFSRKCSIKLTPWT